MTSIIGTGGGLGQPPRQTPQQQRAEMLDRSRRRNGNGFDITSQTQAAGINGYQDALPELDLRPTWQSETQQGFALTVHGRRGGLNLQKDRIEAGHARLAASTMATHFRDEGTLNFATELQSSPASTVSHLAGVMTRGLAHCMFQGRKVMARLNAGTGTLSYFVETSVVDPTVIKKDVFTAVNAGATGIGTINVDAGEVLCLTSNIGSTGYFVLISDLDNPTSGMVTIAAQYDLGPSGFPSTAAPYTIGAFQQVGTAGHPLLVKSLDTIFLQPTESNSAWPGYTWAPATMVSDAGVGGSNIPLEIMAVSGRKPKAYWLTSWNNSSWQLDACNAQGAELETIPLSVAPLWGAAALPARGVIALNGGQRVVIWDGRERESGSFADERPPAGQTLFCTGLYVDNGQLYAEVNELPLPVAEADNAYSGSIGTAIGRGPCRTQKRRYDFDLQRWSAVSDWLTYTEDGLIRWSLLEGLPVPVVEAVDTLYGFTSIFGVPDLPFGGRTRAMHNYAYSALLGASPSPDAVATFTHKFEPLPGINSYSYNGQKTYAESATARSPGNIFGGRLMLADKYLDAVEWGGVDSGGAGSSVTFRWGEWGHLDDADDEGSGVIEATFLNGLDHSDRFMPVNVNRTSVLFPQTDEIITRGDDETLTAQIYPVTYYFHCDIAQLDEPEASEFGRSGG